jgi:hypothetical protein
MIKYFNSSHLDRFQNNPEHTKLSEQPSAEGANVLQPIFKNKGK